ncbi:MAG: hypothetical protein IPO18_08235 [bacterium]|nr:hypothetical protein [bacterium]
MGGTRPRATERRARRAAAVAALVVTLCTLLPVATRADEAPLRDAPVIWFADDARPIAAPAPDERGLVPYALEAFIGRSFSRFWNPARRVRSLGGDGPSHEALDINTLDEVVDSSWFTNRIGLRPLSEAELAAGAAHGSELAGGPDLRGGLVVLKAKTAGVTPGFTVRDGRGDVWLLKFDPPAHPGMTIRAGVVSNLVFHALGFNTPVDRVVTFTRDDLGARGKHHRQPRARSCPDGQRREPRLDARRHELDFRRALPRAGQPLSRRQAARLVRRPGLPRGRPQRPDPARGPARTARPARVLRLAEPLRHEAPQHARHLRRANRAKAPCATT